MTARGYPTPTVRTASLRSAARSAAQRPIVRLARPSVPASGFWGAWRRSSGSLAEIDLTELNIDQVDRVLGVFLAMTA